MKTPLPNRSEVRLVSGIIFGGRHWPTGTHAIVLDYVPALVARNGTAFYWAYPVGAELDQLTFHDGQYEVVRIAETEPALTR